MLDWSSKETEEMFVLRVVTPSCTSCYALLYELLRPPVWVVTSSCTSCYSLLYELLLPPVRVVTPSCMSCYVLLYELLLPPVWVVTPSCMSCCHLYRDNLHRRGSVHTDGVSRETSERYCHPLPEGGGIAESERVDQPRPSTEATGISDPDSISILEFFIIVSLQPPLQDIVRCSMLTSQDTADSLQLYIGHCHFGEGHTLSRPSTQQATDDGCWHDKTPQILYNYISGIATLSRPFTVQTIHTAGNRWWMLTWQDTADSLQLYIRHCHFVQTIHCPDHPHSRQQMMDVDMTRHLRFSTTIYRALPLCPDHTLYRPSTQQATDDGCWHHKTPQILYNYISGIATLVKAIHCPDHPHSRQQMMDVDMTRHCRFSTTIYWALPLCPDHTLSRPSTQQATDDGCWHDKTPQMMDFPDHGLVAMDATLRRFSTAIYILNGHCHFGEGHTMSIHPHIRQRSGYFS